jgi:hypothetical protein
MRAGSAAHNMIHIHPGRVYYLEGYHYKRMSKSGSPTRTVWRHGHWYMTPVSKSRLGALQDLSYGSLLTYIYTYMMYVSMYACWQWAILSPRSASSLLLFWGSYMQTTMSPGISGQQNTQHHARVLIWTFQVIDPVRMGDVVELVPIRPWDLSNTVMQCIKVWRIVYNKNRTAESIEVCLCTHGSLIQKRSWLRGFPRCTAQWARDSLCQTPMCTLCLSNVLGYIV